MNGFDIALVAVVALSALFAFVRGLVREMIALATWVVGLVAAIVYAGSLAAMFAWLDISPVAKLALAFAVILLAVMIVGALVARMLAGVIRAIGLGFVDRMLGAAFGVARGLLVVVAFALFAGVTALPKQDWWQNSALGRPLGQAALALKPYLPPAWADRLDFSAAGILSAGLGERGCSHYVHKCCSNPEGTGTLGRHSALHSSHSSHRRPVCASSRGLIGAPCHPFAFADIV